MKNPNQKIGSLLVAIVLLLTACGQGEKSTPTIEPAAVLTAAAQTASARMTELAATTPSLLPPTPTLTTSPTLEIPATITSTPASSPAPAQTGVDQVLFITDVTVPDGTTFSPGQTFVKTWRLQNLGTSTWTTAYSLVFFNGSQMGGPASVPLTQQVPPQSQIDISASLVAPSAAGEHTGYWMLRNASGTNFGLGPNADMPFYVQIKVSGAAGSVTPGASITPGASPTPTSNAAQATDLEISVDETAFTGACPHTFNFSAAFSLNKAASVTYQLEADTGFPITLPSPITVSLAAGTHTVTYALEFTDSLTGWARLFVSAPNSIRSEKVNFTLSCN